MPSFSFQGQISQNFSDYACELEAMARKAASNGYLWMIRMEPDDKVLVRRQRIHASGGRQQTSVQRRQPRRDLVSKLLFILLGNDAVDGLGGTEVAPPLSGAPR
jgi:hypothetical protein